MTEHRTDDEQYAAERIRMAFPLEAGLSAEKTLRLYSQLRPAAARATRRWTGGWIAVASLTATALVAAIAFVVTTSLAPARMSDPTWPTPAEVTAASPVPPALSAAPAAPGSPAVRGDGAPRAIPALALRAVTETASVLHFTSAADVEFGPRAGHSEEEMWFDPATKSGRLVRTDYDGDDVALVTTIVSDGSVAEITRQEPGKESVTEKVGPGGRWVASFDKLSTYRNMLESETATVTARGMKNGVETYTIRAVVEGFGGSDMRMVMQAEVRASDYLPLCFSSGFLGDDDQVMRLRARTFSEFERLNASDLPGGWMTPGSAGVSNEIPTDAGVYES